MSNDFQNLTPVNIPDAVGAVPGLASSTVFVHNAHYIVTDVEVIVTIVHTFPDDLDLLLVAPDGVHNLIFMSDTGGSGDINSNIAFADFFAGPAPDGTQLVGAYKPTNYDTAETPAEFGLSLFFPLNFAAPAGGATFGSAFGGIITTGTWTLRIADDTPMDTGFLASWRMGFGGIHVSLTNNDTSANWRSDIIWRDATGRLAAWDMNGDTITSGNFVTSGGVAVAPDSSWKVEGISDFSGDDKSDLLWRSTAGQLAIWNLDGSTVAASNEITSAGSVVRPDSSWNVVATGDFGFEGNADVLWRSNTTGQLVLWQMDGASITASDEIISGGAVVRPDSSWSVAGNGDFNGDNETDLLWRNSSGEIVIWQMLGASLLTSSDVSYGGVAVNLNSSWSVAGIGDFNTDAKADILWRNTTTGELALWQMDGSVIASSGDLKSGGAAVAPDATWHIVEIGDFDGDHNSDILWRNDNGSMAEWLMNGSIISSSVAPNSGGGPVAPDATWTTQAKPTSFG